MLGLWYRLKIGFSIGEHLFRKGIKVHAQPVRCTHEQPGHIVLCVCISQDENVQEKAQNKLQDLCRVGVNQLIVHITNETMFNRFNSA